MLTASAIAARQGVSKQAVSRRVQRLVEQHDLRVQRDAQGRIVGIDVGQYEALIGAVGDAAKVPVTAPREPQPVSDPNSLDEARRQNAWITARRAEIELARARGELVRLDRVTEAIEIAGGEVAAVIDRLPHLADDLVVAMTAGGVAAVRKALGTQAIEIRREVARSLAAVASAAPLQDDETGSDDDPH
jgi:DNA-binding Lrp family transcriptional regulator